MDPENFDLWRFAEMFGATNTILLSPATTHLVSVRNDTDKVLQAVELGIPVVRPEWLYECFKNWLMLPLDNFLVRDLPHHPSPTLFSVDSVSHTPHATENDDDDDDEEDDEDDEEFLRRLSEEEGTSLDGRESHDNGWDPPSPKRLRPVTSQDLDDLLDEDL